jgi:hypothetical protein
MAAGLFLAAAAPMDFRGLHAVFVLHQPAHPHHRGDLIFGHADALAAQIFRLVDAGAFADVDAGMAENPRHEGGNAHISGIACRHRAQVAGERQLGNVEFLEFEGAVENLFRVERKISDRAAFHVHAAVPDRAGAVVIAAGDRYRHIHHRFSLRAALRRRREAIDFLPTCEAEARMAAARSGLRLLFLPARDSFAPKGEQPCYRP